MLRDLYAIASMGGVKAAAAALSLVTAVLAAKLFAPADFGQLSLVWSLAVVVAVVVDFGAAVQVRKQAAQLFARDEARREMVTRIVVGFTVRALILAIAVGIAFGFGLPARWSTMALFVVPLALGFSIEALISEALRARQSYMASEYFGGGFRQSIYFAFLLICLVVHLPLVQALTLLAAMMALLSILALVGTIGVSVGGAIRALRTVANAAETREQARFFSTNLVVLGGQQLPLLLAGFLSSADTAASVRVSLLFGMLMQFISSTNAMYFAPKIAALRLEDGDGIARLLKTSSRVGMIFVVFGVIACALLPLVLPLIFGAHYRASAPGAQALVMTWGFYGIFGAYGQMLLLKGFDRVNLTAAIVSITGQLVLAPLLVTVFPTSGYCFAYAIGVLISLGYLAYVGWRATGLHPGPV